MNEGVGQGMSVRHHVVESELGMQPQCMREHGTGQVGIDEDGPAGPPRQARARVSTRVVRPSAR